jgi:mevalonate pyrophosphate decarboxylase
MRSIHMAKKAPIFINTDDLLIENLDEKDKAFLERVIVEKLQKINEAKANLKIWQGTYKDKISRQKKQVSEMVDAIKNKDISNLDYKYGQEWREELSKCES